MRSLGVLPFWPLLGWLLYAIASFNLLRGMKKLFGPTDGSWILSACTNSTELSSGSGLESELCTGHPTFSDGPSAVYVRSKIGQEVRTIISVTVVGVLDFLMTERVVANNIAARHQSCSPPFYGAACRAGGAHGRCCVYYPLVLLVSGWVTVMVSLVLTILFTVISVVMIAVAACTKAGVPGVRETTIVILNEMNENIYDTGVNTTELSFRLIEHVGRNPDKTISGGVMVIFGIAVLTLGQVIFLDSFAGVYRGSDVANAFQKYFPCLASLTIKQERRGSNAPVPECVSALTPCEPGGQITGDVGTP